MDVLANHIAQVNPEALRLQKQSSCKQTSKPSSPRRSILSRPSTVTHTTEKPSDLPPPDKPANPPQPLSLSLIPQTQPQISTRLTPLHSTQQPTPPPKTPTPRPRPRPPNTPSTSPSSRQLLFRLHRATPFSPAQIGRGRYRLGYWWRVGRGGMVGRMLLCRGGGWL